MPQDSKPRAAVTIAMCFMAAIIEGYDIQAFGIAAPKLVSALGLSPSQQGVAASTAMVGLVLGAFFGGRFADSLGRKPVLLFSVATFGMCSLLTAASTSFGMLLLARFITGIGFGGAFPVLISIATEISSPARRSATTCALFCGMPAGGSLVSLFAKTAGEHMPWQTVFIVGGVLPLILLPLLWLFLVETQPARDQGARVRLQALFGPGRTMPAILLATAGFLAFVVLYLMLNWLPALVVAKGHLPGDGAAAAFAFNALAVPGALLLGFLVDFAGPRRALLLAYGTVLAGLLLLGASQSMAAILVWSGVVGLFTPSISFVLYGLIPPYFPAGMRATACGLIVGVGRLGTIAGPLLAGQLRQIGWSAELVIDAMFPIVLLGGLIALVLTSRYRAPSLSPVVG